MEPSPGGITRGTASIGDVGDGDRGGELWSPCSVRTVTWGAGADTTGPRRTTSNAEKYTTTSKFHEALKTP